MIGQRRGFARLTLGAAELSFDLPEPGLDFPPGRVVFDDLAMVVLSTIVAAIGLYYNSVVMIIGAMVIAPLLGPNMAMALATTLGDLPLLWRAFRASLAGIGTVMVLSAILGVLLGGRHMASATGALSLFLMNLTCVNLAGVTTFLV